MKPYLPSDATIGEACPWLQAETGEQWTLQRMIERSLMPWFWVDYDPAWPDICGHRAQGYQAPIYFNQDLHRLVYDGSHAVVTLTKTHDGRFFQIGPPGWKVALADLRFKREDVAGLVIQGAVPKESDTATSAAHEQPAGEPSTRVGTNQRAAWQACNLVVPGDTRATLAKRIVELAAERRYFMQGGAPMSVHLITAAIPKEKTGTRAKNGRKKPGK